MLLITIMSVAGRTITVTNAGALTRFGATVLVAVTWKTKVCAGVSSGTVPVWKITDAPVVADSEASGGRPVAGDCKVQLKVALHGAPCARAGSTQVALSVTGAPLATVMVVPVTGPGGTIGPPGS